MPTNKKKRKEAKKSSQQQSKPTQDFTADRVQRIEERCSIATAAQLEERFQQDYPPSIDHDTDYLAKKSKKQVQKEVAAYSKVSSRYNEGLRLTDTPTNTPGISRWHLVIDKMMDAIDVVLKSAPDAFLKMTGTDRRTLLCKACVTVAQCRGKALDSTGQVAWGKVAVAADPTYFNAHNQLGIGYMNARDYEKALESAEMANRCYLGMAADEAPNTSLSGRLEILRVIVHANDDKASEKAKRTLVMDSRGPAVRWWQEMSMPRPPRTCAFCFWPGDNKCSKCKSVYYCSRECQRYDYKEHKNACVAPSDVQQKEYPKPNFPTDELCSDANWKFFQQMAQSLKVPLITAASNNCHLGAVKRALMQGDDVNTLASGTVKEYPVHLAALRREPDNAVDIMQVLIKHGACPNVMRPDGKHLLSICRERAAWIDDAEPSTENTFFRLAHFRDLEEVERQESEKLVEIVSNAIQQHKLCRLCKARKQMADMDAHLRMENFTDQLLVELGRIGS